MSRQIVTMAALLSMVGWQVMRAGNVAVAQDTGSDSVDYTTDVQPILKHHCFACHSGLKQEGDLRLDTGKYILTGGYSGPAVVAGDSGSSELYDRIVSDHEELRMPQESAPMPSEEIAILRKWIDSGAKFPADEPEPRDPLLHWSFVPPTKPELPPLPTEGSLAGSENPIDRFLAVKHAQQGLQTAALADKWTLLRRVHFDLTGLPPTPERIEAFLADDSPDAYERLVDQLLDSPEYAQRWARHWMDVWRYSDWDGFGDEIRESQPHMWRFRDWIVQSLSEDKPYRQMVKEMLAADELDPTDYDNIPATGFLARNYNKHNRTAWLENTVEHTGKAFLGVTLNCARCHDHKYDPISQREYFQWRAVFEPHSVRVEPIADQQEMVRVYDADLEAATYLLARGDEKRPVKDDPISAKLPRILGGDDLPAQPIELPIVAWNPAARPEAHAAAIDLAKRNAETKGEEVQKAEQALAKYQPSDAPEEQPEQVSAPVDNAIDSVFEDSFERRDETKWNFRSQDWRVAEGRLKQLANNPDFHMLTSRENHPRDFLATYRFTIRGGDGYRSVGFSFDMVDKNNFNAVYCSAFSGGPRVHLFHRIRAADVYPEDTFADYRFELNRPYECAIAVRKGAVHVWIDNELVLSRKVANPRPPEGRFALWTHSAIADFEELRIAPLSPAFRLPSIAEEMSNRDRDKAGKLQHGLEMARLEQAKASAELRFVEARAAADLAAYAEPPSPDAETLKHQAILAERALAVAKMEITVANNRHAYAESEGDAEQKAIRLRTLKTFEEQRDQRIAELEETSGEYTPLAETYPEASTGRRLALARKIVDRQNPLASRVAVNHIWLRHFGSPLVASVFDMGINGQTPISQDLLDWLAVDFMEGEWRMKRLHRLMVTSRTYRLDSTIATQDEAVATDPDNRYFWRMIPRRLEAEAIRDAVLRIDGRLDLQVGGPELDPATHVEVPRRSIYFRHSKEKRITFLDIFDLADVTDCYRRDETVMPQQSLALANSELVASSAARLRDQLQHLTDDTQFVESAILLILNRPSRPKEVETCLQFLETGEDREVSREGVIRALLNHHEFVTVR